MVKKRTIELKKQTEYLSRLDGYVNFLSGLNTNRSKNSGGAIVKSNDLTSEQIDALLRDFPLAKKICLKPSQEVFRKHPKFKIEDEKLEELLELEFKKFSVHLILAMFYEFGFGGSAIILDVQDGQDLDQPVNEKNIQGLGSRIIVVDKSYLNPENFSLFKETEYYNVPLSVGSQKIHKSRMIIFTGTSATIREREKNNGFSDSYLQNKWDSLKAYVSANETCSEMINDFSQTVYNIDGLNDYIGDPVEEEKIMKKALMMDIMRSTIKAIFIDGNDKFDRKVAPLTAVKEFVSIFKDYFQASQDLPHNILFNEKTEGGLSESGKTQMQQWYDFIIQNQTRITPEIDKLINYICISLKIPKPQWEWANLWELDEKEKAEKENKEADTFNKITTAYKNLHEIQVISSEELKKILFAKVESLFTKMSQKASKLIGALKW